MEISPRDLLRCRPEALWTTRTLCMARKVAKRLINPRCSPNATELLADLSFLSDVNESPSCKVTSCISGGLHQGAPVLRVQLQRTQPLGFRVW